MSRFRNRSFSGSTYVHIPIEEIRRHYSAWVDDIAKKAASVAVSEIRKNARQFDSAESTGELKKSIKKKESKLHSDSYIAGAMAPHAHLLEYGHAIVKDGKVVGHVPAYPFVKPAEEAVKNQLDAIINSVIGNKNIIVGGG